MFIHLTTHSAYSLQEGLLQPDEIVKAAQTNQMNSVGLTDHRYLTGSVEFVTATKKAGVQPILGLEIDLEIDLESGPLALLATSIEGWSNLCRLSSTLALSEDVESIHSLELLDRYSQDLIALSDHQLESLKDIFPDRLYVTLQRRLNADAQSSLARRLHLPTVVTHPVYYLTPDQAPLQRTLSAIRLNKQINYLPEDATAPLDSYFMSAHEMETHFADFPEAMAATEEI